MAPTCSASDASQCRTLLEPGTMSIVQPRHCPQLPTTCNNLHELFAALETVAFWDVLGRSELTGWRQRLGHHRWEPGHALPAPGEGFPGFTCKRCQLTGLQELSPEIPEPKSTESAQNAEADAEVQLSAF
ncbi:unnamed protein product [Symbiodinium natans]|uniref:Uncharacterized protein n=1 Tax=Symbiodinium natans TaxID=878477 RepID=A0A812I141_9DINO|nr:unnamed protein product [Symbiodinium natans]